MHASSADIDRRVTFDRAVWTKPLAFAADAVDSAMSVQSWEPQTAGRVVTDARADHGRDEVARSGGAIGRVVDRALRTHLRRRAQTTATDGGWRGGDAAYEVSCVTLARSAWRKSCRAVSRSTMRMGAPQRGHGHDAGGGEVTSGSAGAVGATASA